MRGCICLLVALVACPIWAQEKLQTIEAAGVEKTESRSIEPFTEVELNGIGAVEIAIGDSFEVKVTADENVLPQITTEVVEGRLKLGLREGIILPKKTKFRFDIRLPELTRAVVSGAGNIRIAGLSGESLALELSGAGSIRAEGAIDQLDGEISGAGDLNLSGLTADEAEIRISGTGNAEVLAVENLAAEISGVGNVRYRGSAKVQGTVTGIGHVSKAKGDDSAQ